MLSQLLMCLVCAAAPEASAPGLPSVAVVGLQSKGEGVNKDTAELITANLVARLRTSKRYSRVVDTKELESLLGFERQKQLMDCDGTNCMAELAGALGVDFLIQGSLGRLDAQTWMLNLSLVDTKTTQAHGTVSRVIKGASAAVVLESMDSVLLELHSDHAAPGGVAAAPAPGAKTEPAAAATPPAPVAPDEGKGGGGKVARIAGLVGIGAGAAVAVVGVLVAVVGAGSAAGLVASDRASGSPIPGQGYFFYGLLGTGVAGLAVGLLLGVLAAVAGGAVLGVSFVL